MSGGLAVQDWGRPAWRSSRTAVWAATFALLALRVAVAAGVPVPVAVPITGGLIGGSPLLSRWLRGRRGGRRSALATMPRSRGWPRPPAVAGEPMHPLRRGEAHDVGRHGRGAGEQGPSRQLLRQ